jgi:hypothetical protein
MQKSESNGTSISVGDLHVSNSGSVDPTPKTVIVATRFDASKENEQTFNEIQL